MSGVGRDSLRKGGRDATYCCQTAGGVAVKLNLPSFLLGCGACACAVLLGKRLHPLLLDATTALYRCMDSVVTRAAKQEEVDLLLAEARVRMHELAKASRAS
jgi:hypothetical protein